MIETELREIHLFTSLSKVALDTTEQILWPQHPEGPILIPGSEIPVLPYINGLSTSLTLLL